MSASTSNSAADKFVLVGVPLIVIAVLSLRMGASVGSLGVIISAALTAAGTTIVRHFCTGAVQGLAGTDKIDFRFYALMGGISAATAALSLAFVAATFGL